MQTIALLLIGSTVLFTQLPAQVPGPNNAGAGMGHLHLNAKDPEVQKKFWIGFIGAAPAKLGGLDVYKIPDAIIFVNKAQPLGGTEGSVINHVGLKVRDLKAYLAKAPAAGVQILTQSEKQAMLLAPDNIRLELTEDANCPGPVANHHIHFYVSDVEAAKKWYGSMFGAVPGTRGKFEAADLPGVNLSFSPVETALAGTQGRSLDHIGFEVKNLEDFTKKLEAAGIKFDIPYRKVPRLGVALAFLTDPWGTYIELTEGLTQVQ